MGEISNAARHAVVALFLSAIPAVAETPKNPPRSAGEEWCGPEIVLIGDAWEHVQLERDQWRKLVSGGSLAESPQRLSALLSHLAFMRNRSVMVFGEDRERLHEHIRTLEELAPAWNAQALAGRREVLKQSFPALETILREIAERYPEEALISSSAASFLLPPVVPSLQILVRPLEAVRPGQPQEVRFRLEAPGGLPLTPDGLHTTHTEKLHALLLDPAFTDYHHTHPQPAGEPGEYRFEFTPKGPGPYRLWLDAMPVATGRGEFPIADLTKIPRPILKPPSPSTPRLEAETGGFRLRLKVTGDQLSFGEAQVVTLEWSEPEGRPLHRLQPLMGAFAHVVGFADDFQTILHIHPMGRMPQSGESGGPKIDFELRPIQPGWLRLYVQFSVDDTVRLAEFALPVVVP